MRKTTNLQHSSMLRDSTINRLKGFDMIKWITGRMTEPSSYGAAGAIIVGCGVVLNLPLLIWVGIAGGVVGFVLKEKGVI